MFDNVIKKTNFQSDNFQSQSNVGSNNNDHNQNLNINQNQSYVNHVPEFSKQELDAVVIHKHIAKEIRMEKYKIAFAVFLSILVIAISTFFLVMYYVVDSNGISPIGLDKSSLPYPILTVAGIIVPFIIMIVNLIRLGHLNLDVKRFKAELIMGRERIPTFLLEAYKKLVKNQVYINWLCFTIYLYAGITTGILFGVNQIESVNLDSTIMIFIIILSCTAIIHISSLIFNYKRKGSIDAYYGYEIITIHQQLELRKEARKVSMIFFFTVLTIVFLALMIIVFIIRKTRKKKAIWFV